MTSAVIKRMFETKPGRSGLQVQNFPRSSESGNFPVQRVGRHLCRQMLHMPGSPESALYLALHVGRHSCRQIMSLLCACMAMLSLQAHALTYHAELEESQWYVSSSIFECSIVHDIPRYGQGIFYHEAGEDLIFYAQARNNPMKPGKAALVVEASEWKPGQVVQDLGFVPVVKQARAIDTNHQQATAMMYGLLDGMTPTFTRRAWYKNESIRLVLSSINFAPAYDQYLDCVASLLPVNFRQVERSRIHFKVDKAELTDDDRKRLDEVILYVNADSTVNLIYVDGHTDNSGRRIYNRRLSKARAEAVTEYLIRGGLDPERIQTRYHGERYPIVKNNSRANKAKNRRTTVRLVRGDGSATFENGEPQD